MDLSSFIIFIFYTLKIVSRATILFYSKPRYSAIPLAKLITKVIVS